MLRRGEVDGSDEGSAMRLRTVANVFLVVAFFVALAQSRVFAAPKSSPNIYPRFKFEIRDFEGLRFKNPSSVYVDMDHGEVYIVDGTRGAIYVFDPYGTPLQRLGREYDLSNAYDLVVRGDTIYLSQAGKDYIQVLNYLGYPIKRLAPEGIDFKPGRMDIDEKGNIFVVNRAKARSMGIDAEDNFFVTMGDGLSNVADVAASEDMVVLITPYFSGRLIHAYDKSGKHLFSFESIKEFGGTLSVPTAIEIDDSGNLWVVDMMKGIKIYDGVNHKTVSSFGTGPLKWEYINNPQDIDFGPEGMIYILDKGNKSVKVFK